MHDLARNKRPFYYALFEGETPNVDADGRYDGTKSLTYSHAVKAKMNISPATGQTAYEIFGISEGYTHIIVSTDLNCPIDEKTIIWYGKDPLNEYYNYFVVRKATSLNQMFYAVREVNGDYKAVAIDGEV